MSNAIQVLILGLLLGGVYALMAAGLTLAFGVMRIVNLAHAVFIVAAAYLSFFAYDRLGIDPILMVPVAMVVMFVAGLVVFVGLFRRIEGTKRYVEMTVLLTFALAIASEGLLAFFFTGIFRVATPGYATDAWLIGDLFIPKGQVYAAALSGVVLTGLWALLNYTRLGYGIRATMQNRDAARLVGVNVARVSAIAFGISAALAGASGALISYIFPFFPARHWQWVAILLALIVLGGMGSLKGAVMGALLLAVGSSFVVDMVGPAWGPMTFYFALFVILLARPQGLFGTEIRI